MEVTLEKIDKVNAALKVRLHEADYKPKYDSKIKEYGKKVQLKGFRVGHVPASIIEKMYGKGILVDEINTLVSNTVSNYLKENNVEILGDPLPDAKDMALIDWDKQKDFDFTYTLGLAPEFDLDLSDKVSIENYKITFTDAAVKETVDNLRKQYGSYIDTEVVESDDFIYAHATDDHGKTYEAVIPEYRIEKAALNLFLGANNGAKISVDVRFAFAEDAAIAHVLGIDKTAATLVNGTINFEIFRISHPVIGELNEEFYGKVFRGATIASYEEFESKIRHDIAVNYDMEAKNNLYESTFQYLTKHTKIELPEAFLKEWLFATNEGKVSKEDIEKEFVGVESNLKWDLIKNKIAKEADIIVSHEEVMAKAKKIVQSQFGLADSQLDGEMAKLVDQFADNVVKKDNGKEYRRFYEDSFAEKVLAYSISKIKLNEKIIDAEEYKKMKEVKAPL